MSDVMRTDHLVSALTSLNRAMARSMCSFVELWLAASKSERPGPRVREIAKLALDLINDMPEASRLDTLPRDFAKEFAGPEFHDKRRLRLVKRVGALKAVLDTLPDDDKRTYTRL